MFAKFREISRNPISTLLTGLFPHCELDFRAFWGQCRFVHQHGETILSYSVGANVASYSCKTWTKGFLRVVGGLNCLTWLTNTSQQMLMMVCVSMENSPFQGILYICKGIWVLKLAKLRQKVDKRASNYFIFCTCDNNITNNTHSNLEPGNSPQRFFSIDFARNDGLSCKHSKIHAFSWSLV